jgi:multisubunit Na+/H+ antiporter MnhC subunit
MDDAGKHTGSNNKVAAAAVVTMMLGVVAAISHHPVSGGGSLANKVANISHLGELNQLVHGAIMIMLICLSAAMSLFSKQLGRNVFAVIAASSAYTVGVNLCIIAMGFDGFVFPALADHCAGEASSCAEALKSVLTLSSEVIQAFTRLGFIAIALATMLWSAQLAVVERKRKLALAGLLSVVVQFTALATVAVQLTPHSMLFVVAGQLIWYCVVAIYLWNGGNKGATEA